MNEETARRIASEWHNGQFTGLYAFASSGYVSVDAREETESAYDHAESADQTSALADLIEYLRAAGCEDSCPRCEGEGIIPTWVECPDCKGSGYARTL